MVIVSMVGRAYIWRSDANEEKTMRRLMVTAAIAGSVLLPLAACGDDDDDDGDGAAATTSPAAGGAGATTAPAGTGGGGGGEGATITITEFAFPPATQLAAGGTVTVVNQTGAAHTLTDTLGTFDEEVGAGETIEFSIADPGPYEYVCNFHSSMMGVINVE
jgi:plastocyanin